MEHSFEKETYFSDSEFTEYVEKPSEDLKASKYKVNVNGRLSCSFCTGKKKQDYKLEHILEHASGMGKPSSNKSAIWKSNHYALVKYLKNDPYQFMLLLQPPQPVKQTQSTAGKANSSNQAVNA
ncbi:hypothetical protein Ddye_028698 [Dipteronia dyeriana]|uniref:Zinc finger-XS domain-containing protein n=1 Tax=Dipteronia dyeriana TaxID=168575 RepID=A0AAD9TDV6_9ROSI|nr:hypothetical protein Ddye_028698 [Dipteronia dyeriana]